MAKKIKILGSIYAGLSICCGNGLYVSESFNLAKSAYYCDDGVRFGTKPFEIVKLALNLNDANIINLEELQNLISASVFENCLSIKAEEALVLDEFSKEGFEVACGLNLLDRFGCDIREVSKFFDFNYFDQEIGSRAEKFG